MGKIEEVVGKIGIGEVEDRIMDVDEIMEEWKLKNKEIKKMVKEVKIKKLKRIDKIEEWIRNFIEEIEKEKMREKKIRKG